MASQPFHLQKSDAAATVSVSPCDGGAQHSPRLRIIHRKRHAIHEAEGEWLQKKGGEAQRRLISGAYSIGTSLRLPEATCPDGPHAAQ